MKIRHLLFVVLAVVAITVTARAESRYGSETFFVDALQTEKHYYVYLPPDYDTNKEKRYPVVTLLHGYNFVRNNPDKTTEIEEEHHWIVQEQVPEICDCLFTVGGYDELQPCLEKNGVGQPEGVVIAMKAIYPEQKFPLPPMIVVMPDGDSSFYMNRLDGAPQWPPLDGPDFVAGVRKGGSGQYETYIARDLVKDVDSKFRTIPERDYRGIGGFSMGGVGSMNLLLGNPDVFRSVTSLSGMYMFTPLLTDAFSLSYMKGSTPDLATVFCEDPSKGADCKLNKKYIKRNDPYYRLRNLKRTDVNVYFDAGDSDFFSSKNDYESFKVFDKILKEKGIPVMPEQHIIEGTDLNANGIHTGKYWRSRMGVVFAFHARAFGLSD